ncbi:pantothenate kinase [Pseudomonas borbori]
MILELDCGNSFIKWRVLGSDGIASYGGVVGSDEQLMQVLQGGDFALRACRLVSVRTDEETASLVAALNASFALSCVSARPAVELGGVSNGYEQYERLGLDRWLAVVGAYNRARGACLVLDLGTAVTADFVDVQGLHLGGYICPGMPLMRSQLCAHTRRIRYDTLVAERALDTMAPGRSTGEAVERGCALMLQGFVSAQLELARDYLGVSFRIFLTGGDAPLVAEMLPEACVVPDLVFAGLAIACPLS